eukprot:208711-Prorocentrum_minimum.AAC.1
MGRIRLIPLRAGDTNSSAEVAQPRVPMVMVLPRQSSPVHLGLTRCCLKHELFGRFCSLVWQDPRLGRQGDRWDTCGLGLPHALP